MEDFCMRFSTKFLMAAALVVPAGFIAAAPNAGAAGGTSCAHTSGTATFKPALPKSGSSTTVKPAVGVKKASITTCTGGGVTSAKFNVKAKFKDKTNCDILLGGTPSAHPPTGTITTTWKPKNKSVASVTLNPVSGQPTQTHITGTITSGLFSGMHIDSTISFTPKTGDCLTTDLSAVTFSEVTPLVIS
jgi:hypothetical protein